MSEIMLSRFEKERQTSQWDGLTLEALREKLREVQSILGGLPAAGKEQAKVLIDHLHYLIQKQESDEKHREMQARLVEIHAVLDRSEKLAGRFEQQMGKLLTVVEQQRVIAESSDRQTRKLVGLTWGLLVLTVVLAILTAALLFKEVFVSH